MITVTIDKRNDNLVGVRIEGPASTYCAQMPEQTSLPHDLVHYAVESVFDIYGFVRAVADGADQEQINPNRKETKYPDRWIVESLVECFQAELWDGKRLAFEDFVDMVAATCRHRNVTAPLMTSEAIDRCRDILDRLAQDWRKVPTKGSLRLEFPALP